MEVEGESEEDEGSDSSSGDESGPDADVDRMEEGADDAAGDGDGGEDSEAEAEEVVVIEPANEANDSDNASESHSEVDLPTLRRQLAAGDAPALTLWRSSLFSGPAEKTGECALAVAKWVSDGKIRASELEPEMILSVVRCLERGYAMFEEEEDLVSVFMAAVMLTETPECLPRLLERGALRAMIRGLQSTAHLLLDLTEDTDWYESERLVRIYKAFKILWQTCRGWPEGDPRVAPVTNLAFDALGKWLRGVPLEDVWMGEDDILVFWVLIPLWADYLDHIGKECNQLSKKSEGSPQRAAEEQNRFKEICNWVLWPNDPVVQSGYRLIGHLDHPEGADFSLRYLLSEERFRWVVTPATKQRYLQHRVSEFANSRQTEEHADESAQGIVLVVRRETPLQDLCRQLGVLGYGNEQVNLHSGITVHFGGAAGNEEGVDEGGPWREAIPLMFSEIISPNHGLFEVLDDTDCRAVQPRWCASELVPDFEAQFELCGVLIGMALVYQAYAPTHFSRSFLKHIFGLQPQPEDAPSLKEQLKVVAVSDAATLESLCLAFSVDDAATGRTHELKKGGTSVAVNVENASEYCALRMAWELYGRFEPIMKHVHTGLHRMVPTKVLEAFSWMVTAEELDIMLAGHGINIEDWRAHTEYYGYDEDADIVKWFWQAVESFTSQEREDLWTFISGSKGVPPGGFGHLTNAAGEGIRFTIAKVETSPDHLPVAHTCGYQLDLAQYKTAEDLANKLRESLRHRQGFGLA